MRKLSLFAALLLACLPLYGEDNKPLISGTISNNRIHDIAQDSEGHIWMATFRGLNKFTSSQFYQYYCNSDEFTGLPDNQIQSLHLGLDATLWIGTVNGICRYCGGDDFEFVPLVSYSKNAVQFAENSSGRLFVNTYNEICSLDSSSGCFIPVFNASDAGILLGCFVDSSDRLWVLDPKYLRCFDSATMEQELRLEHGLSYISAAALSSTDRLWLSSGFATRVFDCGTGGFESHPELERLNKAYVSGIFSCGADMVLVSENMGVFNYNQISREFKHQSDSDFPYEVPDFKITRVFADSFGNLWFGSFDQGFKVSYAYKERFGGNRLKAALQNTSVTACCTMSDGLVALGTLCDGIFLLDPSTEALSRIESGELMDSLPGYKGQISSLCSERDGSLWIGGPSGLYRGKIENGRFFPQKYWPVPYPICLKKDSLGRLWLGGASDNVLIIGADDSIRVLDLGLPENAFVFVSDILQTDSSTMMLSTFEFGLIEVDINTLEVRRVDFPKEIWDDCIQRSVFVPSCLFKDSRGYVWIGTVANGVLLYKASENSLERISGTPCLDICSIEEDSNGDIWISSQDGLSRYEYKSGRVINWFASDGIGGNQFYDRASLHLDDGRLLFGGTHGISLFEPVSLVPLKNIALKFEHYKVHNSFMASLTEDSSIQLGWKQNSFSIAYTALDFSEFGRVNYFYKLDGFDRQWIDAHNNKEAYYANVPAGKYNFRVRITNLDQTEVISEASIPLEIRSPWWRSSWAYCIYIIVFLVIVYVLFNYAKAKRERAQEKKVNEMNMSFFANISHEFRSPLTMIAGPVEQLLSGNEVKESGKRKLDIVLRNIRRMQGLVNQLLDFNKLENDTLKLRVSRIDVVEQLNNTCDIFRVSCNEKNLHFKTFGLEESLMVWLDADKLEKICHNLLSNALKFTPAGGSISLSIDTVLRSPSAGSPQGRYLKLCVKDSGPGIPDKELEKIFERYYQLESTIRGSYNWGTGIGLYFARTLARMHHGELSASNSNDGSGAVFTLYLPVEQNAYAPDEFAPMDQKQEAVRKPVSYRELPGDDAASDKRSILCIDDDTEIIRWLKELLCPYYRVAGLFSAADARKYLKEEDAPDLILCDVSMAGESGYDFCKFIKNNLQLSHIPVILLTAKASVEDQVQGLDCGADAYVTKPFEPQYLLALLGSQLKNREKIRALLSQSTEVETLGENVLSPGDNAFMTELYQLMEKELANSELDVSTLTEMLHISRTKFYYKVKGLTGENPSVFFKRYKLNRAAQLLKQKKYNISEIADLTGFSSLSHFSTSFKKQFGVSPKEYL